MRTFLILTAALVALAGANYQNEALATARLMWEAIDKTDGQIGKDDLRSFFVQYADNPNLDLNLFEEEFCTGDKNFAQDFSVDSTACMAYFKLMDLSIFSENQTEFELINEDDIELLFLIMDDELDDFLSEAEWTTGMYYIFRPLPFGVMFLRYRDFEGTARYDDFMAGSFFDIFFNFSSSNLIAFEEDVTNFWVNNGYGTEAFGFYLFFIWDTNRDFLIDLAEWDDIYFALDSTNDGVLYFPYFVYIHDSLLYGGQKETIKDAKFVRSLERFHKQ